MKSRPTAAELHGAGEHGKKAVRRAVPHDDFRTLDRIVFEGSTAEQFACKVFGRLVEKKKSAEGRSSIRS